MSDLKPVGAPVEICGEKRNLLFTLNAVEDVQSEFDMPVLDVLNVLTNDKEKQPSYVKKLLRILLDSEADRVFLQEGKELRRYTERELGMLISEDNVLDVIVVILKALGISMPESSEEESDPN